MYVHIKTFNCIPDEWFYCCGLCLQVRSLAILASTRLASVMGACARRDYHFPNDDRMMVEMNRIARRET